MPNWSGGASGAATGYKVGSWAGPVGGAVGAGIGGLIGLFKGGKKKSATGPSGSDYDIAKSGYEDFAQTGGMSPQDMQNMRSRATSPIRSVYQRARSEVDRQRSLQGGYSPNYTAAMAKMAREQSSTMADASTNVEAELSNMVREGRLAGLEGMSGLYGKRISNPSEYQRKLASIGGTMDTAGRIGESLATIFGKKGA